MIVVIAEKPSQTRELSIVLLPNGFEEIKYARSGKTLEGEELVIVTARGHLYRLADPDEYGDPTMKKWSKKTLPWLPQECRIVPVEAEADRIKTINHWLQRPDVSEICLASDPDREGQTLGQDILDHAQIGNVKVTRLWSNSYEPTDLKAAWDARRSNNDDEYQFLSIVGNCRREMDQLLGINGTRWLSLDAREKGHSHEQIYAYGRVQTTTLAFVVDRERERSSFVPKQFFVVAALFSHEKYPTENELVGMWKPPENTIGIDEDKRLFDREVGEKVVADIKNLPGYVQSVLRTDVPERPVLPHKMVSLQAEASRRHGMTAAETMKAAQALYERGLISYPGTSSRLLPDSMVVKVPDILTAIGHTHGGLVPFLPQTDIKYAKNVFVPESDIGASHSAIIPTRKGLASSDPSWTIDEKRVYDIVARTFVANLLPDKITSKVAITFNVAGHIFDASRSMLKTSGWEAALPPSKSNEKKLQPLSAFWSQITAEEPIYCEEAAVKERATSPPSAFTEATLLEAMEEAHKRVNDDALRVVLQKEGGIGTARTRGEILDNLFEKNLLLRDGRKILSTEAGRDEVDSLPASLKTADFTAQTEHLMLEMRSSGDRKFFREQSYDIVRRMIAEVRFVPSRTRAPVDPKTTKRKASSAGGAQQAIRVGGKGQISGSKSSPPGAGGFPRGNPKTI